MQPRENATVGGTPDPPPLRSGLDPLASPRRLAALAATRLMDSKPDEIFDRLTRLAATVLGVPIAAVTLLDDERQFIKSGIGLGEPLATSRTCPVRESFCQHAVRSRAMFVVEDARVHPLVKDSAAVANGLVSYAGTPITSGGEALGAFCIADGQPRAWTERELSILRDLGAVVESQIAAFVTAIEAEKRKALLETVIDSMGSGVLVCDGNRDIQVMNAEARRILNDEHLDDDISKRPARLGLYRDDGKALLRPDELPLGRAVEGVGTDHLDVVIRSPAKPNAPPIHVTLTARPLPGGGGVMILHDRTARRELERKARLNEILYHRLAGNIPNALVYLVDRNLKVLLAEGLLFQNLDTTPSSLHGRYLGDLSAPENWPQTEAALKSALAGQSGNFSTRRGPRVFEAHVEPVYEDGEITGAIAIYFDVTKRDDEANELRTLSARLQALLEHMSEAVIFEDETFHVRVVNRAALEMFGVRSAEELLGLDMTAPSAIAAPSARDSFAEPGLATFAIDEKRRRGERVLGDRIELTDGRIIERDFLPVEDGGAHRGNLWMHRDITERERNHARIEEISVRDELTGLYNRRGFIVRAQKCLDDAKKNCTSPILFFVDLNGMKPINDKMGHEEGDRALKDTARLLEKTFSPVDLVSRFGGDEFVVLASEPNGKGPATFERELRAAIAAFNDTCTRLYRLSVSIGWTEFDPGAPRTIDQLLTTADAQMYAAKRARQDRGGVSLPPPNSKA